MPILSASKQAMIIMVNIQLVSPKNRMSLKRVVQRPKHAWAEQESDSSLQSETILSWYAECFLVLETTSLLCIWQNIYHLNLSWVCLLLSFWKKQQNYFLQNVGPPCFAFIGLFGCNIFNEVPYRMRHISPDTQVEPWNWDFFILFGGKWLLLIEALSLHQTLKVFKVKLLNEIDVHKHFKHLSVNK